MPFIFTVSYTPDTATVYTRSIRTCNIIQRYELRHEVSYLVVSNRAFIRSPARGTRRKACCAPRARTAGANILRCTIKIDRYLCYMREKCT